MLLCEICWFIIICTISYTIQKGDNMHTVGNYGIGKAVLVWGYTKQGWESKEGRQGEGKRRERGGNAKVQGMNDNLFFYTGCLNTHFKQTFTLLCISFILCLFCVSMCSLHISKASYVFHFLCLFSTLKATYYCIKLRKSPFRDNKMAFLKFLTAIIMLYKCNIRDRDWTLLWWCYLYGFNGTKIGTHVWSNYI